MSDSEHILIIGTVWPEPDSSAAGSRMMQLISLFQDCGWKITFASTAAESDYRADLEKEHIDQVSIELNSSTFDEFIDRCAPSMVIFDRYMTEEQFGWRVAEQCPQALRILDTEDLHCLRKARGKAVRQGRQFNEKVLLTEETAKREIAAIYRSDLSLIISEAEMDLLRSVFQVQGCLLCYLPFLLDPIASDANGLWPSFEERRHFISIGNYRHPPNLDSIKYLKYKIWPLIRRKLPAAEMYSYGAYPTQKALSLNDPKQGFYVKGRAENAREVIRQARISLAPLRFGAGLKGKLIESMQCGTPSVTTNIGAEGIKGNLDWCGNISDHPEELAAAAVELYKDRSKWLKAQENGVRILNQHFQKAHFGSDFISRLLKLKQNLKAHRRQNFIGQMLRHHQMASTKYMSRWIEAKNRNP